MTGVNNQSSQQTQNNYIIGEKTMIKFLVDLERILNANKITTKFNKKNEALEITIDGCIVVISEPFENGSAFISVYKEESGQNKAMRETYNYQDIKIDQVSRYSVYEIADVINLYAKTRKQNFKNIDNSMPFQDARKLLGLQ